MPDPIIPHIPGYKHVRIWTQKGGMGNIFKAKDATTQEEVVIKMMKIPQTVEEEEHLLYYSGLFTFETNLALSIKPEHTHILKALKHGYVAYEGYHYPYLVFPYIKDGSLDMLMEAERPWSNPDWSLLEIADMVVQAAEGLFILHQRNPPIVHQDIKPGNLLWMKAQGESHRVHIWISDFGTAKWEKSDEEETSPIGTLHYMSPEQFNGKVKCTTDQYALAIVARYLLTGSKPTVGPGHSPPPPARLINPPPTMLNPTRLRSKEIDRVLVRALAVEPDERFPDILQFARELYAAILQQENPTLSFTPTHTPGFYQAITDAPPVEAHQTRTNNSPLPTLSFLAQTVSFQAEELEAFLDIPKQRPREIQVVDIPMPPAPPILETVPTPSRPLTQFRLQECFRTKLPATPTSLSWSHDANNLLCTFLNDVPRLIYRNGRVEEVKALRGHLACWSPGNRYIATSSYNSSSHQASIHIWDRANPTRGAITQAFNSSTAIDGLTWSTRGQLAAWVNTELLFFDISEQASLSKFPQLTRSLPLSNMRCSTIGTLCWSPDGSLLAAASDNGETVIWSADRQEIQAYLPASKAPIRSLAWFPDGSMLAAGYRSKRVAIWDMLRIREIKNWDDLTELPRMISSPPHDSTVTIATQSNLLFGTLHEQELSVSYQGQLLASWSPLSELATLDKQDDTVLIILQKQ
ncbi:MAG: protein kinase domain-containing protein [Ktedonobacteraceae bacterium]